PILPSRYDGVARRSSSPGRSGELILIVQGTVFDVSGSAAYATGGKYHGRTLPPLFPCQRVGCAADRPAEQYSRARTLRARWERCRSRKRTAFLSGRIWTTRRRR